MFNLFIDSEQVELSQKTRLQMSRLLLELKDISKRGINISNSVTISFTKKNDRLLGYPSRLNSNNTAFEENQGYQITQQNNIISTGDVVIKSFDEKKGIKIQMAEGYGFWNSLGSSQMIDLDLFEFDEVFEDATFALLQNKTASPFLWGLTLDSGNVAETALSHLQYSRPQYRSRILLDKICEALGYSIDYNNLFTQTDIDNLGFLSNSRNFVVTDYKRRWQNEVIPQGDIAQATGSLEFSEAGNVDLQGNNLVNQLYITSYVIKGVVNSNFDTSISITQTGAETLTERVNIKKGVSFINFRTSEVETNSDVVFSVADEVFFEDVRIYSHINESDIVDIEGDWKGQGQKSILDGYQILTDYNLPTMTQAMFFKTIIRQFFLKIDIDVLKKEVKLIEFGDILSTNNAIDLTGKTLRFSAYSSGVSFAQLNELAYNNEDTISEELGRSTFIIDNKNAKANKSFIKMSEFSASKEILVAGNDTLNVDIYTILSAANPASRESIKDRVLIFKTGVGIPFTCTFSDAGWNVLFNKHYAAFVKAISRERVFTVSVLLSFLDFSKLNQNPIVYIGELGSYFLMLKISGFEEGEFSKIKMAKFV